MYTYTATLDFLVCGAGLAGQRRARSAHRARRKVYADAIVARWAILSIIPEKISP